KTTAMQAFSLDLCRTRLNPDWYEKLKMIKATTAETQQLIQRNCEHTLFDAIAMRLMLAAAFVPQDGRLHLLQRCAVISAKLVKFRKVSSFNSFAAPQWVLRDEYDVKGVVLLLDYLIIQHRSVKKFGTFNTGYFEESVQFLIDMRYFHNEKFLTRLQDANTDLSQARYLLSILTLRSYQHQRAQLLMSQFISPPSGEDSPKDSFGNKR
ncbi:MAG: hypothetical protein KDH94_07420, partial [Coxiellaceae bacterium]|nr:hypothetical protein [Coxiellaceae bacterium]